MTKAKTSTKTMGDGALERALFTHDGYRLLVFDGVPCMLDTDLGKRLGMAEAKAIRKLIKRQESNLLLLGNLGHGVPNPCSDLRRRPLEREPGKAGRRSDPVHQGQARYGAVVPLSPVTVQ